MKRLFIDKILPVLSLLIAIATLCRINVNILIFIPIMGILAVLWDKSMLAVFSQEEMEYRVDNLLQKDPEYQEMMDGISKFIEKSEIIRAFRTITFIYSLILLSGIIYWWVNYFDINTYKLN